jgi:hypothetical protein
MPCFSNQSQLFARLMLFKETNMKKLKTLKKLAIKKVTLRDLDEPALDAVAGGNLVGPHSVVGQSGCLACQTPACLRKEDRW